MASFSDYNAPELRACAKHFKIKGISKMKKADLVALCNEHLKILKSGEVKVKRRGGKSAFSKIKHGVKEGVNKGRNVVTGSTGSKTGDAGLAGVTGTVQAGNPEGNPNYSQEQGKDIADNYNDRRSGTSDYNQQQKRQMKKSGHKQRPFGFGIRGGQLPGSVLQKLRELCLELKGAGLLSGGGDGDDDQGDSPSATDKIIQKGTDLAIKQGDKQVGKAGLTFKDFVDSIEEDPNRDDPNYVVNPHDDKLIDAINKMPVLEGPAKQIVDTVGNKVDAIITKPFEAAMKTAGIPSSTVKVISSYAKPYESTKSALKLLKVTGRQGATKSGEREKFIKAMREELGISVRDSLDMPKEERMALTDALLLAYDVQFPESSQTKYALSKNKPPYDRHPEYRQIMDNVFDIQLEAEKEAALKKDEEKKAFRENLHEEKKNAKKPSFITDREKYTFKNQQKK